MIDVLSSTFNNLRQSKLITNTGTYVLGNFLRKGIGFLLIPIYTRVLTPDDYGIVGLTLAVGGLLGVLLRLGIAGAVARYYYEYRDNPRRLREYITTNFLFVVGFVGSLVFGLGVWGESLWNWVTSGQVPFRPYVQLMLWSTYASLVIDLPMTLYQTQQKARHYMLAQLATFSLTLGATILFVVVLRMGAYGQLLGGLVGNATVAVILSYALLRQWFAPRLRWKYLKASLVFGLPLVPHMLSSWAMAAADRLILEHFVPLDELGLYTLAYSLGMVMSVLVNSVNKAWSPYYFDFMQRNDRPNERVRQAVSLYVAIIGGICLAGALFSQEIVVFLTPERYHATFPYVPLILFAYLLQGYYFLSVAPLFFYEKTRLLPLVTISAALLNVSLNLLLAPRLGVFAAVWATVISYAVTFVLIFVLGQRQRRVDYPMKRYGLVNGIILVGVLLTTFVFPSQVSIQTFVIKLALLGLFALVAYALLINPVRLDRAKSAKSVIFSSRSE
ncbi:MAG: oligosaccharide flippase family protein [Chloroflexota bacterium]|nr:oligosaccharide flippase family protein [Chloroflexota bacterium]